MTTHAEYQKAYYWANRERVLAIAKKANAKYLEANKEKEQLRKKLYKQKNKARMALTEAKRRTLKMNLAHEKYTLDQIFAQWGTDCYLCLNPIDLTAERRVGRASWENGLHIDHFVSLSNGGSDSLDNVRPVHGLCNIKKGNRDKISTSLNGEAINGN
jgi:5-methylcytosine-specific restriction endonuclease McrA